MSVRFTFAKVICLSRWSGEVQSRRMEHKNDSTTKNANITKFFPAYFAFFGVAFVLFTLRPGSTYALDNLRVATASMTSPSVLYLLMAQKEGYFKNEGLNVEIINMRGEIAAKIAVAGEIDFFTQALSGLTAKGLGKKIDLTSHGDFRGNLASHINDLYVQPFVFEVALLLRHKQIKNRRRSHRGSRDPEIIQGVG